MRLLEFEAKEILARHQIAVPKSQLLSGFDEINLKFPLVLKVQIPLGGRGKAGGVLVAHDEVQAGEMAAGLLATPIRGYRATCVLAEEQADISAEYYLALTYDTVAKLPLAIFSAEGGVASSVRARKGTTLRLVGESPSAPGRSSPAPPRPRR